VFLRQAATEQFQRIGLTPSDVNGLVDETAFPELSFGQDPIVAKILSDDHVQGDLSGRVMTSGPRTKEDGKLTVKEEATGEVLPPGLPRVC
jgi:hypothetical protein